jgi:enoyl-CoA hydratase
MPAIHLTVGDGVAQIEIDNPEVRNALTPQMADDLAAVCDQIDGDSQIGAAVVTGAGNAFCSGADTRTWTNHHDPTSDEAFGNSSRTYKAFYRFGQLQVPTVAAVRGVAVGAGTNLVLAADLRVVAHDARLMGFTRTGIHPGGGFFTLATRAMGRETTAAVGLFGAELNGHDAVRLGLAWETHPADDVLGRALDLAKVAARDPQLARKVVHSFRIESASGALTWDAAVEFERGVQMWSMRRRFAALDASTDK